MKLIFNLNASHVTPDPPQELGHIGEHGKVVRITAHVVLQSSAHRNDPTEVPLVALLEDHSAAAVSVAHRRSIPEAGAKRRVRGDLAEEVPVGPDASLVRHHRHLGKGQLLADQTALGVAPTGHESHLVDHHLVILVKVPQASGPHKVVELDVVLQPQQRNIGEEPLVVVVRMDDDPLELGVLLGTGPLLQVGLPEVK